jgi:signal recognition particle subunit SRP54
MFEALSDRFNDVFRNLKGVGRISEKNVRDAMREVRTALLEADVHISVVKQFCDDVLAKSLGDEVIKTLHPEQVMIKVVHDELVRLMGPVDPRIPFVAQPPTVILMAGLQGSGKTTTCGKLARMVMQQKKHPMLVAADLQRPAAIDQLEVLGGQLGVPVHADRNEKNPLKVCRGAIAAARKQNRDVVILDTAGRLAVDEALMGEISQIANVIQPHQIYLVCDAMTGQDAVNSSKAFNDALELDGVILTKFDSDTRGGAALAIKAVTGKPIKFIGVGEKLDNLEAFHPDRMAGRILGMGDVVSLVEKAQQQYTEDEAATLQKKMEKGLSLQDFLGQIKKMQSMGSMKSILKMIPGLGSEIKHMDVDEDEIKRMEAIILSMTPKERTQPSVIDASRRRRIAAGSGTEPADVSGLVKSFSQARDMMKMMSGMGMADRMKLGTQFAQMSAMGGKMPKFKTKVKARPRREDRKAKRKRRRRK